MSTYSRQDQDYLKTLTVLYVEDDPEIRKHASQFLTRPVGSLIIAADGLEGLEAFKTHNPDIVITDILMPKMDGLAMAAEILGIAPSVPIIVATAFELTDYLIRAINIGIEKYVVKPVDSQLLFKSLLECAHRLRAEEELKFKFQREIMEARSQHNETYAILAGGIAEDYNNLMQAIIGYASIAKIQLEPDSNCYDSIEHIVRCCDEAQQLGNMLRILGNDYTDDTQSMQLMPCISAAIKHVLTGSPIELQLDYPEDLPDVMIAKQQMELVFAGLATNALEAMPSGGSLQLSGQLVEVTMNNNVPLNLGAYILVTVTDSGPGIDPEVMPRIFQPYFSTKHRALKRGTGLNLALCRTVIMRHGGIITAESIPGSGTKFSIWLPAAK